MTAFYICLLWGATRHFEKNEGMFSIDEFFASVEVHWDAKFKVTRRALVGK